VLHRDARDREAYGQRRGCPRARFPRMRSSGVAGWLTDKAQGIYATVKRRDRDAAAAAT
jgi:hypothetical protein